MGNNIPLQYSFPLSLLLALAGNNPMIEVDDKLFEVFITEAEIAGRVDILCHRMNEDLKGSNPVFLVVLNGAFYFAADLLRGIDTEYELSFVKIASYDGMLSGPEQKMLLGLDENLAGRHVVVIEDIIDSGKTMYHLVRQLREIPVSGIKIATLILKPNALRYQVAADYVGFETPDDFLLGYGLDFNKKGRHYRDIYKLKNH